MRARPAAPPPVDSLRSDWQTPAAEKWFSLPVLQNFVGTVQAAWGPTGVQNWHAPPTALPTPVGLLYRLDPADGSSRSVRRVDPAGTSYQIAAAELLRRHPVVSTTTRLAPPAADPDPITGADLVERLTFHQAGTYAIVFGGLCRVWGYGSYWNLPPEDVPQLNVTAAGDSIVITDNKTFGRAVVRGGAGARIETYQRLDDLYAGRPCSGPGRLAAFVITVEPGDTFSWSARQGVDSVITAPEPDAVGGTAIDAWEGVWQSAFTDDDDHFSGRLPAITFDDAELDRLYYAGILALIHGRRTFRDLGPRARFATGGQAIWTEDREPLRVGYTTGATDGAATTSFLWELHQAAPLLSRLDPVVLREQLELFLRVGVDRNWGVDLLTGQGVGMWYGVNDGAILAAAADYLAGTGDLAWLDRSLGDVTVRERLLSHVDRHRELAAGAELADYGGSHNVLECVSSYEHGVASFNALAAWCHRFAAGMLDPERSAEHEAAAARIERAVLGLFAGGPFRCRTPSGDREVRTCLDFIYVGRYLTDALDQPTRAAMLEFFTAELATEDWMRALSPKDTDSLTTELPEFQTFRADHQSTGAYGGWPGLCADVRLRFGDHEATLDWLRRISRVTREGPFGQAYWVGLPDAPAEPARKASFFNGNCSTLVSGCTLTTTLLDHFHTP
ncbi:hypothetical protein [Microlunatus speluncae]|uniref:hypothetical protein n=1 Tax=Microlunatus speluncae TaxID=2594267 RepID=UPI0012665133|nr:hypothetical protein [Microlunatus speluncae]